MNFRRASGVLLHPTSLPGPHGSGDLGASAYHFVDWLLSAGQSLWQVLPLGGIGPGNSPYMASSAFAGNELLIDLHELHEKGWLDADALRADLVFPPRRVDYSVVVPWRMQRLRMAASAFAADADAGQRDDFAEFCERNADWLDDYALFMALAEDQGWRDWSRWDPLLATRAPDALRAAAAEHRQAIAARKFCQWCFHRQWTNLKDYANLRGVRIVGDMPIFVALQSADVWSRPELFELDATGQPTVVAGVPPDFFSATGQRWGNPLYRWAAHADEGYAWWVARMRHSCALLDLVRVDHFRGFAGCWEIPAAESTAMVGRWTPGPGAALFDAVAAALGKPAIIAEDLGVITPDVEALRRQLGFPGMRILQFAFGGDASNAYLPHNYERNTVVYTGTHDNTTTRGWWQEASVAERHHACDYLNCDGSAIEQDLLRAACASVADTAIHPMQDLLGLDAASRMNLPGEASGYWEWRFDWDQVEPEHAQRLHNWCRLYRRTPA